MKNLLENNGANAEIINNIFLDWQKINDQKGNDYFKLLVKNQRFGTYKQFNIIDIITSLDAKIDTYQKETFIKEVKNALK